MGLATVVPTEYGYYVTGDTDPTPIWADDSRKYIQNVVFSPGATNDTVLLANQNRPGGTFTNFWSSASAGTAGVAQNFRCEIIPATNLRVTFSSGSGKVYIYVRSR